MQLKLILLSLITINVFGAEVTKVKSKKNQIVISHDKERWEVGNLACVKTKNEEMCGGVIKVGRTGALVQFKNGVQQIVKGASVRKDSGASFPKFGSSLRNSQRPAQKLGLGGVGGITLANVSSSTSSGNTSPRIAMVFGAALSVPLAETLSLEFPLLYTEKGPKQNAPTSGRLVLDYLETKIALRYTVPRASGFFISTGPYFGYLLYAREISVISTGTRVSDVSANYKSIDFGINGTLGVEFPIGDSFEWPKDAAALLISASYDFGLANLAQDASSSVKSRTFLFLMGLTFFL